MFITDGDYAVVIGEEALKVTSRSSERNRTNAVITAIEEISGYLRPVYDCEAIFSAEGNARNMLIVTRAADIALYHLASSLPQKMGIEIRKERYDRAIKWLEDVQAGIITPDLPLAKEEEDTPVMNGTIFHSEPRLRHNW